MATHHFPRFASRTLRLAATASSWQGYDQGQIRHYVTASGKNLFEEWLDSLKDAKTEARIAARIARLAADNFGDCKPLRDGVWELRIKWGPGYRIYYAVIDRTHALLLCGGDRRSSRRTSAARSSIGTIIRKGSGSHER